MKVQVYDAAPSERDGVCPAGALDVEQLKGKLPVDALMCKGRPYIKWLDMSDVVLSEPFFHQSVAKAKNVHPERTEILTDINALIQFEKVAEIRPPTGFIFHASRCGSTLVANACRALNGSRVISEAFVIDKLLAQLFLNRRSDVLARLWQLFLRGAVNALGQSVDGDENHFVIKFACSGTLQLERVRQMWPQVPWLFVYRDPVEIIVSNLSNVPDWMRTEEQAEHTSAMLGITSTEVARMSREEFCARALGEFYQTANEQADDRTMFLAYEQMSPETLVEAVRFFGAEPSPGEIDAITKISTIYSKDSTGMRHFDVDGVSKRAKASPLVLEMAERWARKPYERLRHKHHHHFLSHSHGEASLAK